MFDETLGYLTGHEGVWFATGAEIAQYYLDHHYDTVAAAVGQEAFAVGHEVLR